MSFGLSGSSGTGKTTLALKLSEVMKIPYYDASVTKLMGEIGFNPVGSGAPLDERIAAQTYLLREGVARMKQASKPFITDRTPIDFAAYMMGEITMTNSTVEQGDMVRDYVLACVRATQDIFDSILVVRPLPVYTESDTRPKTNAGYQTAIQTLIEGVAFNRIRNLNMGLLRSSDLGTRIASSKGYFEQAQKAWLEDRENSITH